MAVIVNLRLAGVMHALEGILRDLRALDGTEANRVVEVRCADDLRAIAEVLDHGEHSPQSACYAG